MPVRCSPRRAWRTRCASHWRSAAQPTPRCTCGHRQRDRRGRCRHHTRHLRPLGRQTPLIAKFAPASRLTVVDLHAAGGIPAVLSVLAPLLDRDAPTVDGRTIGEIAAAARVLRDDVLHPLAAPIAAQGGIAVLRGNLAPDGAVVKQSAVAPAMHYHIGPARVFESEEEVRDSLMSRAINPATCW